MKGPFRLFLGEFAFGLKGFIQVFTNSRAGQPFRHDGLQSADWHALTGDTGMKGTQPGDTPSKDREAQNILKNVGRPHKSLGVGGVDGTCSLGLPSPLPY